MIREAISKLVEHHDLTQQETESVMGQVMAGEATPSQIGAFLTALRMKGETPAEIAGGALAMRAHSLRVYTHLKDLLVDTCGTGGDSQGTFNISTVVALVVAGAGLPVAKHGNRSVSSRCGSADLLEALGARIDLGPEDVSRCINEVGFGFLFAQRLHPAMKNVAGPRKELGIRTIFNLLGPLTNPAAAPTQLMGVYSDALTETMAQVLRLLGTQRAMVVHSSDGLDELSLSTNKITRLVGAEITTFSLTPGSTVIPWLDDIADQFDRTGSPYEPMRAHPKSQRAIERLARRIAGLKIGLALGTGAALGHSLIGILKVFKREGIPIDIIAGTSIGSIIAGFTALGMEPEEIEELA
ncbi:MAG: anthranilate phosphoribosyltransferase, partial [Dehalococcoidia bacterium]|nr:anthranilate phosphoribosyltransferase [Dehalococcoidia bacterium]